MSPLRATLVLASLLAGCAAPPGVATIDPIHAPPEAATADYWFARPAGAAVRAGDYDRLWHACEAVVADRLFDVERRDYRNGLLTTRPLLGGQLLEFWRRDVVDPYSVAESNVATVRRTIRFELVTVGERAYEARPKVVVERRRSPERRVTIGLLNRNALSAGLVEGYNDYDPAVRVEPTYWHATRRDENLEAALADDLRRRLKG